MQGPADAESGLSGHIPGGDLPGEVLVDEIAHPLGPDLPLFLLAQRDLGDEVLQNPGDLEKQLFQIGHFAELRQVGIVEPEELLRADSGFDGRPGNDDDELDDPDLDHLEVHPALEKNRPEEFVQDLPGSGPVPQLHLLDDLVLFVQDLPGDIGIFPFQLLQEVGDFVLLDVFFVPLPQKSEVINPVLLGQRHELRDGFFRLLERDALDSLGLEAGPCCVRPELGQVGGDFFGEILLHLGKDGETADQPALELLVPDDGHREEDKPQRTGCDVAFPPAERFLDGLGHLLAAVLNQLLPPARNSLPAKITAHGPVDRLAPEVDQGEREPRLVPVLFRQRLELGRGYGFPGLHSGIIPMKVF